MDSLVAFSLPDLFFFVQYSCVHIKDRYGSVTAANMALKTLTLLLEWFGNIIIIRSPILT